MQPYVVRQFLYHLFLACAVVALLLLLAGGDGYSAIPAAAHASALVYTEPSDDDLMLMAVQLGSDILSNTIDTYITPAGLVLPLGEICRLLSLGITVDPDAGKAVGFIIDKRRDFELDLTVQQVTIAGHSQPVDPVQVQLHRNDIYVNNMTLAKWLPVDFTISINNALITIKPREMLPMQQRMERERRLAQAPGYLPAADPGYPRVPNPYRFFSSPTIDQNISLTTATGTSGGGTSARYTALMTGDIGYLNASLYLDYDQRHSLPAARLTLNRIDTDANLLGPLHAAQISLLDTPSPDVPLVASSDAGTGVLISNYPLFQQTLFDTHSFSGDLPTNWEVELYRDDVLLAYFREQGDGSYEFRDVPLLFGSNRFRLVFYGPHNEKREEEYRFEVGDTLVQSGEHYYQLAYNRLEDGGARYVYRQQIGLRDNLTLDLSGTSLTLADGTHNYAGAGLRGFYHGLFTYGDLALDGDGGSGAILGLQTRLGPTSVFLQHTMLEDFSSALFPATGDPLRAQTTLRLDGIPSLLPLMQTMSVNLKREQYASGTISTTASNRLSLDFRQWRFSHYLNWHVQEHDAASAGDTLTGELLASRYYRRLTLRGNVNYSLKPDRRLDAIDLSMETPIRGSILTAGLRQSMTDSRIGVYASYSKPVGDISVGVSAACDGAGSLSTGLTFSTGLARDTSARRWESSARSLATQGAVLIHVFHDWNCNGKLDDGEAPVKDAGFFVNRISSDILTDERGFALITGLRVYQPTDLSLSLGTLEDPLWMPRLPGVRFIPRPGVVLNIDFPIESTGEITGTVEIDDGTDRRYAAGMPVELLDAKGAVVQSTRAEYDGFFMLAKVPVGTYILRVSPTESIARRFLPCSRSITVPPAGAFIDGADLILIPAPSLPTPAE